MVSCFDLNLWCYSFYLPILVCQSARWWRESWLLCVCVLASLPWYVIMLFSSHTYQVPYMSLYYYSWITVWFLLALLASSNLCVVVRGATEFLLILMNSSIKPSRHTWRQNNVVSTLMRCHDVGNVCDVDASTLTWRCFKVVCQLSTDSAISSFVGMIWANVVRHTPPLPTLYSKPQTLWSFGSREVSIWRVLPYISMWVVLVMWLKTIKSY